MNFYILHANFLGHFNDYVCVNGNVPYLYGLHVLFLHVNACVLSESLHAYLNDYVCVNGNVPNVYDFHVLFLMIDAYDLRESSHAHLNDYFHLNGNDCVHGCVHENGHRVSARDHVHENDREV